MNDQSDSQLLREYAEHRSEPAFTELVRRYVDFVHSAALRMVCDSHLAQDVTQGVFVALAKNTTQLSDRPVLSGWLHRTAQNIAAQTVRTDVRRRAREQEAVAMNELLAHEPEAVWEKIAPHLDAALGELSEPDRDALLLRYFDRKSAREMAQTLNVSEEAAQKRVSRAVERLREFFAKSGVTVGASGLVSVISANAVQAAPVGLAAAISTAVTLLGTITSAITTTSATTTTMNWINAKTMTTMLASVLVAGTGTYLVQQMKTTRLRNENQRLQVQQEKLMSERDAALLATANDDPERALKEKSELIRLRGEVGLLRQQKNEAERLREENQKQQTALAQPAKNFQVDENVEKQKVVAEAKMSDARNLVMGMILLADKKGEFPKSINDILAYSGGDSKITSPDSFELVYVGPLADIKSLSATIVIREKEAWDYQGKRRKSYGFADGHSVIKTEPQDGFEAWEKEHMMPQTSP
ncbi:MAG: sigma-70 family RNA polymerase sigma factor [Verrucomicrobiota bacterium]